MADTQDVLGHDSTISRPLRRSSPLFRLAISAILVLIVVAGYLFYRWGGVRARRMARFWAWIQNPAAHPDWAITAGERCGEAPFQIPTDGFVGFLWGDSFRPGHRHQGIDIFGGNPSGQTPVFAAASGYLTRMPDWVSSVIIRLPDDPLLPGRQIWTYYTHLADRQGNSYIHARFPPGTSEMPVEAGELLGYQGDYSGDPSNPVGVHLHFSVVLDDGQGSFRNELKIQNTLDPSPYLGLPLNAQTNRGEIPLCSDP